MLDLSGARQICEDWETFNPSLCIIEFTFGCFYSLTHDDPSYSTQSGNTALAGARLDKLRSRVRRIRRCGCV